MDDIRIKFSLNDHIKTLRLIEECGFEAYYCLINLWIYVAKNTPKGKLKGYKKKYLEKVAKWTGNEGVFVDNLLKIGFIDGIDGGFIMHDWKEHQPFVYKSPERKKQARNAGLKSGEQRAERKRTISSTDSSANRSTDDEPPSSPILSPPNTRDSDKSEPSIFEKVVLKLFPDVDKKRIEPQARELERIHRLDNFDIKELYKVLKWGRKDDFWSQQFLSCAALRKKKNGPGDAMKWEKMRAGYEKSLGSNSGKVSYYHCPKQCDGIYTVNDLGKPCNECGASITEFER